jgi:serine/threonine-protein kinase 24/25/MST4
MTAVVHLRKLASSYSISLSDATPPPMQPNVLTRSPSSSPRIEKRGRGPEPSPVPSSNPASQYTLLEKLGTGSFGTVWKGIHNETKQIVAIKQIGAFISRRSGL